MCLEIKTFPLLYEKNNLHIHLNKKIFFIMANRLAKRAWTHRSFGHILHTMFRKEITYKNTRKI